MYPWDHDRRRFAANDEQNRINEEITESDRRNVKSGSGFGYLAFIMLVTFLKPIAEYFIDLYNALAGYVHSIGTMIGL